MDPLIAGKQPPAKTAIPLPNIVADTLEACRKAQAAENGPISPSAAVPPEQPTPLADGTKPGPNIVSILADDSRGICCRVGTT